jgi:hypothetical protein
MPPDDFREGVLRIFARELPEQIQIACHSFESISPPTREIRQVFEFRLDGVSPHRFFGVQASLLSAICRAI